MTCGIYVIIIDDLKYVGASRNIEIRFWSHMNKLKKGTHVNKLLQEKLSFYGEDNISKYILEECAEKERISREKDFG